MEKEDRRQLELFSQPAEGAQNKTAFSDSFFGYIRGYEKAILLIIALIVTGIIFFSLGVEKGRRAIALRINQEARDQVRVQKEQPVAAVQETIRPQAQAVTQEQDAQQTKTEKGRQNYTIQVATFSDKSRAVQEVQNLKKKGFSAMAVKKGSYNVVCVGSFADKDTANSLLTKLKKTYHDGFIKKL